MKKYLIFLFACFTIIAIPSVAYSQELQLQQAYFLNQGTVAPTSGYLLTPLSMSTLVAKYKSQQQTFEEQLTLEIKHAQDISAVQCDKLLADKQAMLDTSIKIREAEIDADNKKINVLTTHIATLEKKSSPPIWLYVSGGIVAGVLTTLATTYAVNHF